MKSPRGFLAFLTPLFALPLPLLGACSDSILPSCASGQVLLADAHGVPSCSSMLAVPDTQLGDAAPINARLTALEQTVQQMQTVLDLSKGRPSGPVFIGTTTKQSSGQIVQQWWNIGVRAAAGNCSAEFGPGARLCTPYDLYRSVTTGVLAASATIASAWIYFPAWGIATDYGALAEPEDGLSDNCAGYTYQLHSNHWYGVFVQRSALPTGPLGFYYYGNLSYDQLVGGSCTNSHPLACCQ